jgi:aldehyde:ferredoxin oxidoreductase
MMGDFTFRVLCVNLDNLKEELLEIPTQDIRSYLGGSSLAAHILYPYLTSELEPLEARAPLLFLTGPLTGTKGPAVGRYVICAKSPATGLWGESNVGGYFGPELRAAGYDGLLLTGRCAEPSYVWVHDGNVDIRSAGHLWGIADTYETQEIIKKELDDPLVRVACIGLAGENLIPIAIVLCDHGRVAGRTGMGALMGSKNLKAIAVRGHQPIPIDQPELFQTLRRQVNKELRDDNLSRAMREGGTSAIVDYFEYLGAMPKKYFTGGVFEGAEKISGATVSETILSKVSTCSGCVIACGRVVRFEDGDDEKGPEYETTAGFGSNLMIDDIRSITRFGDLCDRYGMDVISLSNIIGLAFLLYQEGFLTEAATGGEKLTWGEAEPVERLIHLTARKEGIGELLSRGALALADHYGVREMAAQVNNLEVPYHDPRALSGMALVYATSPRGACHNQSDYFMVDALGHTQDEIGVQFYERRSGVEKVASVALHQDWRTVGNALVMCVYANISALTLCDLIRQVTGFDYSLEELMTVGERAWNLKRVINHRLGLTNENDRLPKHLLKPLRDGGAADYVPPLTDMLVAYYQARGWDAKTGRPSPERMKSLGLDERIPDIW